MGAAEGESMKQTTRNTKKAPAMFAPAAWQWDPEQVSDATASEGFKNRIQFWSASGCMSIITVARAKELVAARAAFVGGPLFIDQTHEHIDGCNAAQLARASQHG